MILNSKIIGEGPSLIILHGLFGSLDNWFSIAKYLSANFQVHILDQRNHGKSFHDITHNYNDMCSDLFNYVSHYSLANTHLLGHSMGGKTAMYFALKYPEIINKLIIVDIAPKKYPQTHKNLVSLLREVQLSKITRRKEVEQILMKNEFDMNMIQFLLKNLYWINDKELKFRFNIESIYQSLDQLMNFELLENTWNGFSFFIKGQKSNYILDSDLPIINSFFPNFKLFNIPDSGHWVHFDQKTIFLKTINNILNT